MRCHGGLLTVGVVIGSLIAQALAAGPRAASAAEPFTFEPATHGQGSLSRIGSVPVLVVRGTPAEMGDQLGALLAAPLAQLAARQADLLGGFGLQAAPAVLLKVGTLMASQFPADHLAELKAASKSSGVSYDFLLLGNVLYDFSKIGGCSVLMVDRQHSASGEILFGRNMDFPTFGFLDRCSLLVIYVPNGKHAFASVTFPGFFGCISGMNDAGLAIAQLEVNEAKDGSTRFTPAGTPLALCFRRVLEECETVDQAEKLLGSLKRTSMCNLAICDRRETAVLEITTQSIVRRRAEGGYCACTNHFRSPALATDTQCDRYDSLAKAFHEPKLDIADVARKMNEVHQGEMTIHTMIFEPARGRMQLALGPGPVTGKPLQEIDLGALFASQPPPPGR